jgi:hypothetical protein
MNTAESDATRRAQDTVAPDYDEFAILSYFGSGSEALRRVALRPGIKPLDVAAGATRCAWPKHPVRGR